MKKYRFHIPVILILILLNFNTVRADRIVYTYDASGNRTLREKEIVYSPNGPDPKPEYRDDWHEVYYCR